MADIVHRIGIRASRENVYKSLSTLEGLRGWWTEKVTGSTDVGGIITFAFTSLEGEVKGEMDMKVEELTENMIVWKCLRGPAEWINTTINFQLTEVGDQTIVNFSHKNWTEIVEFFGHCSMKWATFLLSLRTYNESGKGSPSPNDLKIDNWN